ncbi:MAG: hypothetical protein M3Z36_04605 [Acidobacteriota bacterium]|nr:hypothetical protein [Acidobacteriota bacterium]
MYRLALLLFALSLSFAQNAADLFKKAPPAVDQALRERISKFYQFHVDGKFRLAEQMVAEESKDAFYAANKPNISSFRIDAIEYSDDFSKAKATIVGKMVIMIMGFGDKPMDVPFPSYWKIDNGQWSWYINYDAARNTPFGRAAEKSAEASQADPRQMMANAPNVQTVLSKVKADRSAIRLKSTVGSEEQVTVLNEMPGAVRIRPERNNYPGLEIKLDREALKANEKAVVTFRTTASPQHPNGVVRLIVEPTNQPIDVQVTFN